MSVGEVLVSVKELGVMFDMVPLPLLIVRKRSGFACETSSCGCRYCRRDGCKFFPMYERSLLFSAYFGVVRRKEAVSELVR